MRRIVVSNYEKLAFLVSMPMHLMRGAVANRQHSRSAPIRARRWVNRKEMAWLSCEGTASRRLRWLCVPTVSPLHNGGINARESTPNRLREHQDETPTLVRVPG